MFYTVMAMKNVVFWDINLCGSCKNRRFGGKYRLHHQVNKKRRARDILSSNFHRSVRRLLVTANTAIRPPILFSLVKEVIRSSETSVLTRATRRDIQEDGFDKVICAGLL
jgi:hypothetical protein